jgi:hypothetical protein
MRLENDPSQKVPDHGHGIELACSSEKLDLVFLFCNEASVEIPCSSDGYEGQMLVWCD